LAHRQHHALSDKAGDPYGPHLGRFGSYLAIEWMQNYDTEITAEKYFALTRTLRHLGLTLNDYEGFRREGSFERLSAFALRMGVAQVFWSLVVFSLGGVPYLVSWYASIFVVMFLMRDFNYSGHGRRPQKPGWEFQSDSLALNQRFYGYLGSEWHNNHHQYPRSASCSFARGQPDLAFQLIRGLYAIGIVTGYHDSRIEGRRSLLRTKPAATVHPPKFGRPIHD
jgi:fatty-acid desaturase